MVFIIRNITTYTEVQLLVQPSNQTPKTNQTTQNYKTFKKKKKKSHAPDLSKEKAKKRVATEYSLVQNHFFLPLSPLRLTVASITGNSTFFFHGPSSP